MVKVSGISYGIDCNLWENATDVFCISTKLAINMIKFKVSEVSGNPYYYNCDVNSETESYVDNLIFI